LKIRSQSISDATLENIHFRKGLSISTEEIRMFYNRDLFSIGGVTFEEMAKVVSTFVDTTLDARRAPLVAKVLGLDEFSMDAVVGKIFKLNRLTKGLIDIFRTPGDEFDYNIGRNEGLQGLLEEVMVGDNINVVFLDSGEFSSLPEWEIVAKHLRIGGYVILHDIFFPKSFKNWLVCSSIMANSAYKTMYIDRSTPQGLMVAQKIK
jgi:hypothetical protein